MKLYDFTKLATHLDVLRYPQVKESRFQIIRKDFSEEEKRGNITFKNDGIYLDINGVPHKGYMYIKVADVDQYDLPKFHISNCQTIIQQKGQDRFHGHYFWSNSNIVDVQQRGSTYIHQKVKLNLCSYCKKLASVTNYNTTQGFFDLLDIQDKAPQILKKVEVDIFGYIKEWQQISKKFRIEKDFTCDKCSIKIENKFDQRYIQVHHRDGNKLNNKRENLQCLCTLCHANVDEKHSKNFSKKRSHREVLSFIDKYRETLNKLKNPFLNKF